MVHTCGKEAIILLAPEVTRAGFKSSTEASLDLHALKVLLQHSSKISYVQHNALHTSRLTDCFIYGELSFDKHR